MSKNLSTRFLGEPWAYLWFQHLVGPHARTRFLQEYVCARAGHSVLDVGCGPGLLYSEFQKLVPVEYQGVDIDAKYVASACRRLAADRFRVGDVCTAQAADFGTYDRVVAYGLLHHLTDPQVECFFRFARSVLKPGGQVVTLDGTLVHEQNRFARVLIALDRGQNIRAPEHYRFLAQNHFAQTQLHVRHDLQAIPYSCAIVISQLD